MRGYRAMHNTRPDFFIHSGDTVYADGPLAETVMEKDGQVWRNLVTEEVSKVAETLTEFRGRHRYNSLDANMRAMFADVPVIANWDDHETTNNWYPGEILDDPRYTVRDVNTLAARGRQAWQENMPIPDSAALWRPGTFDDAGQYRPASTGRSAAARSWISSAWTCARSRPPTQTARKPTPPPSWARSRWTG
jgi:alkaline phosphatase D